MASRNIWDLPSGGILGGLGANDNPVSGTNSPNETLFAQAVREAWARQLQGGTLLPQYTGPGEAPTSASMPVAPMPHDTFVQELETRPPGSGPNEICRLMPGSEAFGMCLYLCPSGDVRSLTRGPLGCQRFIFRHHGLGL